MSITSGTEFAVNEIFTTIQGEATFAGTPATFVRLQGCDVGCPWCDTKHTWDVNPKDRVSFASVIGRTGDGPSWALVGIVALLDTILARRPRHVVITGGEPCVSNLSGLTLALITEGMRVQIETSGTEKIMVHPDTWVTVSPKYDMPGNKPVLDDALRRADEIKIPFGKLADVEKAVGIARKLEELGRVNPKIWLQPLSQSVRATEIAINAATEHGWRVSCQVHRYLGVR